jgi:uncharacterized membrane protein YgcG
MFYFLLMIVTSLCLIGAIIAFICYCKGIRFFKSDEQQATEAGLEKIYGKDKRCGFFGGAESETHNHSSHHSDSGGGHDSGGGGDGGGGGD